MTDDTIYRAAVEDALNGIEISRNASWYEFYQKAITAVGTLPSAQPGWIPCSKKLPEMHDAGILKKVGIKQRSKMVYITIEGKRNDGSVERITDAKAELRDGEWYSDTLRWLKATGKKIEVTAWMPYPEPYNPEGDEKVCLK